MRNRVAILVLLVVVSGMSGVIPARTAKAAPCPRPPRSSFTTFYTDSTHSTVCGHRILGCSCGAQAQYTGCVTNYYTVVTNSCTQL